nr:hypothetical protein [Tanacetum cinerariifolium]
MTRDDNLDNSNGPVSVTTDTNSKIKVLPPKTAEKVMAREREGKDRTTLLMALVEDHLKKFHKMADAKGTTTSSSSNIQNVAFVYADNTSNTNDVAMISIRIKKFHKRTGKKLQFDTKDLVGFDKTKVECFDCHKMRHFARDCKAKGNQYNSRRDVWYNGNKARDNGRRPAYQDDSKALVTIDGEDIDWSEHVEEDVQNYAMMAYCSSNSGSNNAHKKLLAEALKEKEDLKTKFENWQHSSKNLSRLLNTQTSANDKFGLRYGDYRYGTILSYENEVLQSVFMNKESDLEDTHVNDRYAAGMHAVLPPMTGNYMPSGPDVEIDYSKFSYGPNRH